MLDALLNFLKGPAFRSICFAVILLAAGIFVIRIVVKLLTNALEKSRLEKAAHSLITSLCKAALYLILGLSVASALGIDVTGIVALASVLTLALSLALQNMVSNIIGGFTILYTHPFHSGDFVEIAGQSGTVVEINMTYTMLSTPDSKLISIPNSAVTASYDCPPQQVIDALVQAGTLDSVLLDPAPMAVLTGYGDSAISYSLRVWVKSPDYWDVYFAINQRVSTIFAQQGIEMTYPHLNVHMIGENKN